MFDIKYLILDEDKDILCNIKNVEEYELEISSITGQLEFICNGNSHGFVYPDAPCNDEFLLEWFIELNSVIISLKSNSFVTMMIPCIINRWLEFKSIDEMILITKISAKPVMPILEQVVNTPIERDEILWSEYIPRDEFISKTLEITEEINAKYSWCANLYMLIEKEELFYNCFAIIDGKFNFIDAVKETDRMIAREKAYKGYNPERHTLVKEAIYTLKSLKLDELERTSPLGKWFYEVVQKSVDELTLRDVLRMLRQEVYLDIAIPIACTKALEDPFCGEMYVGEMIDFLTKVFISNPNEKKQDFYKMFAEEVQQKWETFEWESDYEKEEYKKLLLRFSLLFE